MELDFAALRWAKAEALERLARSLRVALPAHLSGDREKYHRRLARMVAAAIEESERQAAVEARRAMEQAERTRVADEIADQLGEEGAPGQAPRLRVRRQLERMIQLMGEPWVREFVPVALRAPEDAAVSVLVRADGEPRTTGGAFFAAARTRGHALATSGEIAWKTFYNTFCWRLRSPRRVKTPKPPKAPRARPVDTARPRTAQTSRSHVRRHVPPVPVVEYRRRA